MKRACFWLSSFLMAGVAVCLIHARSAKAEDVDFKYKSGYFTILKLGRDIYGSLKPPLKEVITAQPISFETDSMPFAKLSFLPDEPKPIRGVWLSAGFIDLVNLIAHAKAIDLKQKGFLLKYVVLLAQESGEAEMKPLPNDTNPKFWTDDMLNEQLSNFNSIVGMVVGISLAHHYLGHYEKYKDRLADAQGHIVPINALVSDAEWDAAVAKGARNALDAGCTIEGVLPFFECFDKMPKRPAWAAYFIPDRIKYPKLKKDLERIQKKFFAGDSD